MELHGFNKRKKNKKVGKSFDLTNATKTFKKLVEKHRKEKIKNKIVNFNKADEFFKSLTKIFFKEEIKETDFDYIFREIKNQNKINQNLIDTYGVNASKKIMPYTREPIKYDKNLIMNPMKNDVQNHISYSYFFSNKSKESKKINLPCIIKNSVSIININKKDSTTNVLEKKMSKKELHLNSIKIDNSFVNKKKRYNTINNERYVPIKTFNFFSKTNNMLNNKKKVNNKSTFSVGNKTGFDRSEYLQTLDSLNDQIRHTRKRHRKYFSSNDYGCGLFKNKYNYIRKNFFS
jgi:hypothetical protein